MTAPQRPKSRTPLVVALIAGLLAAGFAAYVFVAESSPAPAQSDPFDRAAFDTYWNGLSVTDATRGYVTSVAMESGVLTAHTKLHADNDAKDPATVICGALNGYWLQAGRFEPVRVLDSVGQILVSRRTESDSCTWRR